jgi:NTE family protein
MDIRAFSPVEIIDTGSRFDSGIPISGIGLCLSGGGYRATLFHLGALWRLNQAGYLPKIDRISSVSGGSIIAGVLGLNWEELDFDQHGVATRFYTAILEPIRAICSRTIDAGAILGGALGPGSIGEKVISAYRKFIYGDATLQDLPDKPRFVINATNVQSGALWRFMKPYMCDYRVGKVENPEVLLAVAVAASTAFPPFLSPLKLELDEADFMPASGQDLQYAPFTTDIFLSDGGVYDNLGLETVWKKYDTVLVSDGGGKMQPEAEPKLDWARHTYRTLNLIDNQVRSLRKRRLIESYKLRNQLRSQGVEPADDLFQRVTRNGTYWGIRSDIKKYTLDDVLDCPEQKTLELANTPTRMKRLDANLQEKLINWGYAICDAALRRHVDSGLPAPTEFPYHQVGVG